MPIVKAKPESAPGMKPARPHLLGAHVSIAGGVDKALAAAQELRCNTAQLFVKNQRQWNAKPLRPDEIDRWHALRTAPGFGPLIAHATYLINLASPVPALYVRSQRAFADELERCRQLHIPYLVVHPGSATGTTRAKAVLRVAKSINRVFDRNPELNTMPLLETTAGTGNTLGRSFDELGEIISLLAEPRRVGVCIDTCHVFAAGYDIRRPELYEAMIEEARRTVGLGRIRCWHVNDSRGECGSRIDRHEHIGRGRLGSAAFTNLLGDARFDDTPMILETPKGADRHGRSWDRVNLRRLRSIATRAVRRRARAPAR